MGCGLMTISDLQAKVTQMKADLSSAMSLSEKSWLLREIAATEERITYAQAKQNHNNN